MLCVLAAAGTVGARELHRFAVGGWTITANGDAQGHLQSCTAAAGYNSGLQLLFLIKPDESWAMALSGTPVKQIRARGGTVPLALKVDALAPRVLNGRLAGDGLLVIRLPEDDDMFESLRQGRRLYVAVAGRSWIFDLTNTYAMLTALYHCAAPGAGGAPDIASPGVPEIAAAPPERGAVPAGPEVGPPPAPPDAPPATRPGTVHTGSGFFVQDDGVGLTNAHVVEGCRSAMVSGYGAADIVARDGANDLAVVRLRAPTRTVAAWFRRAPLQLGESVYVMGFPLAGELDNGLNFTSGLVSSLAGAGNDARHLQLTAPIQLGNSGGPIVDKTGYVVGVTQSKFNDLVALERSGSVPQNLNFGIKASLATDFLQANGFEPREGGPGQALDPTDIARNGRAFTFQIICKVE